MISLGKIVKVRGNRGEVVLSPPPRRNLSIPGKGDSVLLKSSKYRKSYKLEYLRKISGVFVLKFAEINTINEALKLVGYTIFISAAAEEQITGEEFVGYIVKDMKGVVWGEIINMETNSLNKTLEIQGDNDILYVPFDDSIVKEIDEVEGIIIIDPPSGLKELNK